MEKTGRTGFLGIWNPEVLGQRFLEKSDWHHFFQLTWPFENLGSMNNSKSVKKASSKSEGLWSGVLALQKAEVKAALEARKALTPLNDVKELVNRDLWTGNNPQANEWSFPRKAMPIFALREAREAFDLIQVLRAQAGRSYTKIPNARYRKIQETYLSEDGNGLNLEAYKTLKKNMKEGKRFSVRAFDEIFRLAKSSRKV